MSSAFCTHLRPNIHAARDSNAGLQGLGVSHLHRSAKDLPLSSGRGTESGSPAELGIVHAGLVALHDSLNRIRECGIHGLMHDGCMISGILGSDASSLVPPKSSCPHSLKLFRFVLRMWRK